MISLFGSTGFVGSAFREHSKLPWYPIKRNVRTPVSRESLFLISTTDNYNVFSAPLADVKTNLITLLETLRKVRQGDTFNFVSSWFVYGHCALPATEDTPCDPRGFYSITKRAAEQLLVSYCTTHKINWRIFRLANVYGSGDSRFSERKNALTHMIRELKRGNDISLYWGGESLRNYIHVTDVVRALDLCLTLAPFNSVTNIGAERSYYFGDLMRDARDMLGSPSRITAREPTEFHQQVQQRHFVMDTLKLQGLGFKPTVSMSKGLGELCEDIQT